MLVIMISHNQRELLQNNINVLKLFSEIKDEDIVIVDNASEDGTREWIEEQKNYNYIICDEKIESYAVILNAAIEEFYSGGDVFVLVPNYIPLPGAVQEMISTLHSNENIGAVSPTMILCGTERGKDYNTALSYVQSRVDKKNPDRKVLMLETGAILIKQAMLNRLGKFEERLFLPSSGIMDFVFRGVCQGYEFLECQNAYFYRTGRSEIGYEDKIETAIDRPVLKEKWNMNYFNAWPNWRLTSYIREEKQKEICVLEIGCDCGANLLEIKNNYPNAKLYGVELNVKAAEIASHLANVQTGNVEDKCLDFGEVRFDYIIFGDVLEHLRDPEETVKYCRELLKKDGRIIASIPNLMHYAVMRELINGNFTYADTGLLDRTHIHFFTYKEIIKMFARQGYHIEHIEGIPSSYEIEPESEKFVNKLVEISNGAEKEMFYAFQYIVIAKLEEATVSK